jgi:aminoglycoside/choline kinase family phosphotransferase
MHVPDKSQEIAKATEEGRRWPFLEVRDLLEQRGVRVPKLLHEACPEGVLLVQDLGDHTLANFLLESPDDRETLYKTAISDLARAQVELRRLPEESIIRERAFDHDLLLWEVEHFSEWALEARGIALGPEDRATFDEAAQYLATTIAAWPRGFVHRDYQSRNLMVTRGATGELALTWIDFQDAMLGPRVYDLVALLTDSYQTFSRDFVEQRLDEYARHLGLDATGRLQVGWEFEMVTVQRKLKDAGRFVFIDRVNNNPNFLGFVDSTISKARLAISRVGECRELQRLGELLDRIV